MNIYKGLITALITPFKDNKIDKKALEKLIELQIQSGIYGLVIGGSTGEGTSLDEEEYYNLIQLATQIAAKKTNIIAGLSAVSTESAIKKVKKLNALGVDGIMCTSPHYIRPEQDGIIKHFQMIHENTNLPLMLYIHLGRTGVDLTDSTILKLAESPRIIAVKDAGTDISRPLRLSGKLPLHFSMMTGNDENSLAYSANGGNGCVSVISNIFPKECKQLQDYLSEGNYSQAIILQQKLLPIYEALCMESNPISIKYAMHLLNLCSDEIKLPLTIARLETRDLIKKVLMDFKKL
mgnify:CR=1 FL=1